MSPRPLPSRALAVMLTAVALHATADGAVAQTAVTRTGDTAFNLSRTAVIDISVTHNDLVVRGSDRPTAELRARTRSYKLQSSGVAVSLAVGGDDARSRQRDEEDDVVQLLVPRGVRLVVHGASGDVSITDVTGDVDVHVQSGDIHTRNLGGRAIIETLSGDINVQDGVGDLRVTTVSGDVTARRVRGTVDVNTTSGTIVLSTERTPRVQVEAMSGDITLSGSLHSDAQIQLVTHSGDVALRLPESVGGLMDITTFNGEIASGGMTLLPSAAGTVVRGDLARGLTGAGRAALGNSDRRNNTKRFEFGGGGAARISVSTFNGDVSVQRLRRDNEEQ